MASNIVNEIKRDESEAADWLLYYHDRKHEYYKDLNILQNTNQVSEVNIRAGVGNPTQDKIVRLSGLVKTEKWLETIEIVEDNLSPRTKTFLKVRREAAYSNRNVRGRPAWIIYVQHHYAKEMAKLTNRQPEDFWLSDPTIKLWWKKLIDLTVKAALKRGCL